MQTTKFKKSIQSNSLTIKTSPRVDKHHGPPLENDKFKLLHLQNVGIG